MLAMMVGIALPLGVAGGWGNGNSDNEVVESNYGNVFAQDWLYSDSGLSMKVEGCVWADVEDNEEVGCLQDESEDGTTNWYMMANCKRPQVVFSVYSNSGCNSGNFRSTYVTSAGLPEFIYYLQQYDGNSAFNNDDDDGYAVDELPVCGQGDNGYLGLDCNGNDFVIGTFSDEYCNSRTGTVYNSLSNLNKKMDNYQKCNVQYTGGDAVDDSLIHKLVYYSEPCSSYDHSLCQDSAVFNSRSSSSGFSAGPTGSFFSNRGFGSQKSWVTKLKYAVGGLFLLTSLILFTGILFTNRRRRRAMMMRKYRQSKKKKSREDGKRSSRGGSRSRRSKSRNRESRPSDGVLT